LRLLQEAKDRERTLWEREIDAALSHVKVRATCVGQYLFSENVIVKLGDSVRPCCSLGCTHTPQLQVQEEKQRSQAARSEERLKQLQEAHDSEIKQARIDQVLLKISLICPNGCAAA
jgi:hypothetical protein